MGPEALLVFAGLQAVGQLSQGVAAKRAGAFNARAAEQDARLAAEASREEEADFRRRARLLKGAQRAAYGASGVVATEGSPLLVAEDTARETELEARRIRHAGSVEEARALSDAAISRFEGESLFRSSIFQAAGTLGSGAYRYNRATTPPKSPAPRRAA